MRPRWPAPWKPWPSSPIPAAACTSAKQAATVARAQVAAGDADVYLYHGDTGWSTTWESESDDGFITSLTDVLSAQTINDLAAPGGCEP